MPLQPNVAPLAPAISAPAHESPGLDERWSAWQAKGAAHDRVVRRRLSLWARALVVIIGVVVYAWLER